jgi:hypothetical protein
VADELHAPVRAVGCDDAAVARHDPQRRSFLVGPGPEASNQLDRLRGEATVPERDVPAVAARRPHDPVGSGGVDDTAHDPIDLGDPAFLNTEIRLPGVAHDVAGHERVLRHGGGLRNEPPRDTSIVRPDPPVKDADAGS